MATAKYSAALAAASAGGGAAIDVHRVSGAPHLHTEGLALFGVGGPQLHAAAPLCAGRRGWGAGRCLSGVVALRKQEGACSSRV